MPRTYLNPKARQGKGARTGLWRPAGIWLGLGLCLLAAPGQTRANSGSGHRPAAVVPRLSTASEPLACPALFGDRRARMANARVRAWRLDFVQEEEEGTFIAHMSSRWQEPVRLRVRGLELVQIRARAREQKEKGPVAVFRLLPDLARAAGCRPGDYPVAIDANLTPQVRVLSVLERGVLVEHGRRLGFIVFPSASAPRWFLAWRLRVNLRQPL